MILSFFLFLLLLFFASEISKSFGFYEVKYPSIIFREFVGKPSAFFLLLLLLLLLPTLHTNGTGLVWFLCIYLFACLLVLSVGR